jgi:ferredoxin
METFVWLDKDLCSGCGRCGEIAPSVFQLEPSALSYIHKEGIEQPSGRIVGASEIEASIRAAEECPGEIIFVESLESSNN